MNEAQQIAHAAEVMRRVAIVQARTARANARVEGMRAENAHRLSMGHTVSYGEGHFDAVVAEESITETDLRAMLEF